LDVRTGERLIVVLMFSYLFLINASNYLIKPFKSSLFLQIHGAGKLPHIYIATAAVVGITIFYFSRWSRSISPFRLTLITLCALIASLLLFRELLFRKDPVAPSAFYIWADLFPLLLVSQFWLLSSELFTTNQAKRLFGVIGAGGLLGGVAGSIFSGRTADILGSESLLVIAAGLLGLVMILVLLVERVSGTLAGKHGEAVVAASFGGERPGKEAWALVKESPHLQMTAAILGLSVLVSTMIDWQFSKAVETNIPGMDQKTAFFGHFFAVLSIVSMLIQLLFTNFVLKNFKIGVALLLLPAGVLTASTGILLYPGLWTAALSKGTNGALRYSLDQTTRELLYFPVPTRQRFTAKPFIDLVVFQGAAGLAGVILLVFASYLGFSMEYVSLIILGFVAIWIWTARRMHREFRRSLRKLLETQDVEVEERVARTMDATSTAQLKTCLSSEDPDKTLYAFTLLEEFEEQILLEELPSLLHHPSEKVRLETVRMLLRKDKSKEFLPLIQPLLMDPSLQVRIEAIHFIAAHGCDCKDGAIEPCAYAKEPGLRAAAASCLASRGGSRQVEAARTILEGLIRQEGGKRNGNGKVEAVEALGFIGEEARDVFQPLLQEALEDPDNAVRRAAMESAGRWRRPRFLPYLTSRLCCPDLKDASQKALIHFGPSIHVRLLETMLEPSIPMEVKKSIPPLFYSHPSQDLVDRIVGALPAFSPRLRRRTLKTLDKIRRNHPAYRFDAAPLEQSLVQDLRIGYQALIDRSVLLKGRTTSQPEPMIAAALEERKDRALERISRNLVLIYPLKYILSAYKGLTSDRAKAQSFGAELLYQIVSRKHRLWILPLVDPELETRQRITLALEQFPDLDSRPDRRAVLERVARSEDNPWVAVLAALELETPVAVKIPEPVAPFHDHVLPRIGVSFNRLLLGDPSTMLTIVERAEFLRGVELFSRLGTDDVAKVAAIMEEREYRNGRVLFQKGDMVDEFSVIVKGRVRLDSGRDEEPVTADRGRSIGVHTALSGLPSEMTAKALEATSVLVLKRNDFYELMRTRFEIVEGLIEYFTQRIRDT
jgi:AAA family ATP:ADP antiporter